MDNFDIFHDILVNLFNEINDIEEKAIITSEFKDITNNDMHVIEAIGLNTQRSMSVVAHSLSVTVGTLTIAINNLVKKGYVIRRRSDEDRRVVLISLTEKGNKAYNHHKDFHEKMISATIHDLSSDETRILIQALQNLREFFNSYK